MEFIIENRTEWIYKNEAYITMKDHKDNFPNNLILGKP